MFIATFNILFIITDTVDTPSTTASTAVSVKALSLIFRITNRNYSTDLADKNSQKYIQLNQTLYPIVSEAPMNSSLYKY